MRLYGHLSDPRILFSITSAASLHNRVCPTVKNGKSLCFNGFPASCVQQIRRDPREARQDREDQKGEDVEGGPKGVREGKMEC